MPQHLCAGSQNASALICRVSECLKTLYVYSPRMPQHLCVGSQNAYLYLNAYFYFMPHLYLTVYLCFLKCLYLYTYLYLNLYHLYLAENNVLWARSSSTHIEKIYIDIEIDYIVCVACMCVCCVRVRVYMRMRARCKGEQRAVSKQLNYTHKQYRHRYI